MMTSPRAMILSTGSEILQGLYSDTNATTLSRQLGLLGFEVVGHMALPDQLDRIVEAIRATFGRCELVVSTGGLGPTEDDLTRDAAAIAYGVKPRRVHRAVALMRERYARRGRELAESSLRQADLPEGSRPLLNFWGTAPGFLIEPAPGRPAFAAFPGVPHEMREMTARHLPRRVVPLFPQMPPYSAKTIHVVGIPESELNDLIRPWFKVDGPITVGVLASRGQLRVRVRATAGTAELARAERDRVLAELKRAIPPELVYAEGPEVYPLEKAVLEALAARGATLAVAESCTGGGVAHRLTAVPGSSDVFVEGFVTYANAAKVARLGVPESVIAEHGAVSAPCAAAMAEGARRASGATVAVSITGIAGPSGGTPTKPVGTVFLGLADESGARAFHRELPGDREAVRWRAEVAALDLARRWAGGLSLPEA